MGPGDFSCSTRSLQTCRELLIPCLLKDQYISVYINIFHCLTKLLGALLGLMFSDDVSLLLVTLKLYQKSQVIQYLLPAEVLL